MLQTDDIGVLFSAFQAAYGHQWAHRADAMAIWQGKLKNYDKSQVMAAASQAIEDHPNFPPSIGQFLGILKAGQPRAGTYLPAPDFDKANADKAWADMEKLAGRKLRPE